MKNWEAIIGPQFTDLQTSNGVATHADAQGLSQDVSQSSRPRPLLIRWNKRRGATDIQPEAQELAGSSHLIRTSPTSSCVETHTTVTIGASIISRRHEAMGKGTPVHLTGPAHLQESLVPALGFSQGTEPRSHKGSQGGHIKKPIVPQSLQCSPSFPKPSPEIPTDIEDPMTFGCNTLVQC